MRVRLPWAGAGPLIPPSVNHPAIGTDIDLDLFGVFRVTAGQQRLAAVGADTLLGRQFTEFLPDQKGGIIPSLGSGVARLLAPLPFGLLSLVLGIVQVIGAILQRRGLGASAEEIGLELPLLTLELFDFLLQRGDAEQGIAVATLPISDLLAELEILASQALDFGAQLDHFPARVLDWVNQLRGGAARTTDLYQLVVHDQLGLPRRPRFGKRRVPFYPLQTDLYGRDRRSFTFHFAAEHDLRLSLNDALTKLSGHLLGIVTVEIQLVSNLFIREIQPHKIEAEHPDPQRLVVTGKDRPGEVVEPLSTAGALILLSFRLGFVVSLLRDLGRVAVGAGHPLGPTHRSDGLKAPGIVNEVQDVQHPCTHHPS